MSESVRSIAEIPAALDLTLPFCYPIVFPNITTNTGSATVELNVGDKDLWVVNLGLSSYDDAGVVALNGVLFAGATSMDKFSIEIKSVDGVSMTDQPMDVYALSDLGKNQLFKGIVFKARTKYTFILTGQGIPTAANFTTFIKFELDLFGYLLLKA
jgi:hypothetical protein